MLINVSNLSNLFTAYNGSFRKGFDSAPTHWERIAMRVTSGTAEEEYGWMQNLAGIRKWLGDRIINNLSVAAFTIVNEPFEWTVSILRDKIEDDRFSVFAPVFEEAGRLSRAHPDELIFALLANGFTTLAYDGQFFFDTDHVFIDENGAEVLVSNNGGGAGPAWFLMDTSRAIKPLIFQVRRDYNLVRKDREEDDNVFMRREFVYGVDARVNAGFGLWQLAYGTKQPLDATNYAAARQALMEMKADGGRKLGIVGDTLVVPASLEQAARQLLFGGSRVETTGAPAGDTTHVAITNEWRDSAELVVSPYL